VTRPRPGVLAAVVIAVVLIAGVVTAGPAEAYDPAEVWKKGSWMWSVEGGYGWQFNLEDFRTFTGIEFVQLGARWSLLPFGISGAGSFLKGAFEAGVEPMFMYYTEPSAAYWAGAALLAKYHFLALGRIAPYLELGGAFGATDLKVREIDSSYAFLLLGGVGASYMLTDTYAVYAGYRYTHNSNGNTDSPNRGFESHTGVIGFSVFLK
jgi:opacity protein-like surface antigen